jgi:hypothetical protein
LREFGVCHHFATQCLCRAPLYGSLQRVVNELDGVRLHIPAAHAVKGSLGDRDAIEQMCREGVPAVLEWS